MNHFSSTARAWLRACWGLALLGLASSVMAQTPPAQWTTNCASCHGDGAHYVNTPSGNSTYGIILPPSGSPWLTSVAAFRTKLQGSAVPMNGFGNTLSDGDIDAIRNYLIQARDAVVTSSVAAFPNTLVSTASATTRTVTITNGRAVAITYGAPSVPSDFTVSSESCGSRVVAADGGACTITLRFTPQAAGARSGNLSLSFVNNSVDPTPPARSIALSGTGTAPSFSIPSGTLTPSATVGTPSNTSTTISNVGNADLVLGTLSFSGAQASEFSLAAGNTCTAGLTLTPSSNCTLTVRFDPAAAGTRNASLSITHNATGSPQAVTLTGTASPAPTPSVTLSAASLAFADTQLGSSSQLTLTVGNNGQAPLVFSSIGVSGAAAANYVNTGTCSTGTPLAVSGQCTVIVTFSPSALGARAATLNINSNASNSPTVAMSLSGNGIPVPAPLVSLSAGQIDFGNQTLSGLYLPRVVTLTNTGTANLNLTSLSLSGAGFALSPATPCPSSLAPSAHCDIQVTFTPSSAGANYTGTVTVVSNAAGSPHQVNLLGHGTAAAAPTLAWSPLVSSAAFGSVTVGTLSATQTVTLSNPGPGGATLNLVNAVGADAANFTVSLSGCAVGNVLYEGETCQVVLQFVPGSAGAKTANVQIASSGSPPTALTMTGTGLGGPTPQMTLSATSLAFGHVTAGAHSAPLELRLTSSGANALRVSSLQVSGQYSLQDKTCPTPPFDLPAGTECSVMVSFNPNAAGNHAGAVQVMTNASPASVDVTLDGQGDKAADVSSGGCSLVEGDSALDPTLWVLAFAAAGVLVHRRRAAARGRP
ncbi:MAG: choice-of-anchor D domain-containing protein [Rubrivivax sp.]|nr:MAG: choice-of-anchor D domain-containing protein [Rubrivivax sp.]